MCKSKQRRCHQKNIIVTIEATTSVEKSVSWAIVQGASLATVVVGDVVGLVLLVIGLWRKFFVANPTKNVTDPLLAFCAPNCLKINHMRPCHNAAYGTTYVYTFRRKGAPTWAISCAPPVTTPRQVPLDSLMMVSRSLIVKGLPAKVNVMGNLEEHGSDHSVSETAWLPGTPE